MNIRKHLPALGGILAASGGATAAILLTHAHLVPGRFAEATQTPETAVVSRAQVRSQSAYDILVPKSYSEGGQVKHVRVVATVVNTKICIGCKEYVQSVVVQDHDGQIPGGVSTMPTGRACDVQ